MATTTLARPVALARGDVLRIRDGSGLTLRPESGVLWVTEEKLGDDRVIAPGDACRLEGMGLALVYAHRASRVVIEGPRALAGTAEVRIATHGDDASRRVRLDRPARRTGVAALVGAILRAVRRALRGRPAHDAAVGGYLEHDLNYSSRRRRGAAGRVALDPRAALMREHVPYF